MADAPNAMNATPAQPQVATPPAPATAQVTQAVAQRFAEDDMNLRLMVNGKERILPVSKIKEEVQMEFAGRERLDEAKRFVQQNRALIEAGQQKVSLDNELRMNPVATMQRLAREHNVDLSTFAPAQQNTDPVTNGSASQGSDYTRELLKRVERLEGTLTEGQLISQLDAELDSYPLFKNDSFSRENAKTVALAHMNLHQGAIPRELLGEYHTRRLQEMSGRETAVRDSRAELVNTMPNIPSSAGAPPAPPADAPKFSDLRGDGSWFQKAMKSVQSSLSSAGVTSQR